MLLLSSSSNNNNNNSSSCRNRKKKRGIRLPKKPAPESLKSWLGCCFQVDESRSQKLWEDTNFIVVHPDPAMKKVTLTKQTTSKRDVQKRRKSWVQTSPAPSQCGRVGTGQHGCRLSPSVKLTRVHHAFCFKKRQVFLGPPLNIFLLW